MKIIVTGSLGNISKPLAALLLEKMHDVTVISSDESKRNKIEAMGASVAIGSLEDVNFLTDIFKGADVVYGMIPPNNYFDHSFDLYSYVLKLGNHYVDAIQQSGVKRVVFLSSIGAHLESGSGLISVYNKVEHLLSQFENVNITFMRPTAFYYNLYGYVDMIKSAGFIAANYGGDHKVVWVSPLDIAAAVADEIETPFIGKKVRYVASEELTGNEVAAILGAAIGKPDLEWKLISNEEVQKGLEAAGMNPTIAAGLVEMYDAHHKGTLAADYFLHRPEVMGKVKMVDFAKEFAAAF